MKQLYPPRKEWLAIRAEVMERAGNRCEWQGLEGRCNIPHGQWGVRDLQGRWWTSDQFMAGEVPEETEFEKNAKNLRKAYKVVLTIAHRDHDPRNNGKPGDRPNLAAWCQYHHLRYDAMHHARNARKTRDRKRGQESML